MYNSTHVFLHCFFPPIQGMDDLQVRAAAIDIFSYLVEFSPSMVREFVMQEPQQTEDVRTNEKLFLLGRNNMMGNTMSEGLCEIQCSNDMKAHTQICF